MKTIYIIAEYVPYDAQEILSVWKTAAEAGQEIAELYAADRSKEYIIETLKVGVKTERRLGYVERADLKELQRMKVLTIESLTTCMRDSLPIYQERLNHINERITELESKL